MIKVGIKKLLERGVTLKGIQCYIW